VVRTWKQGAVGRLALSQGRTVYVRCLKYPLAQFFEACDRETLALELWLCDLDLEVSALKGIERLGVTKLGRAELICERKSARDLPCGPEALAAELEERLGRVGG
jgi:hypothetical protein